MGTIDYVDGQNVPLHDLLDLYGAVGWTAYTDAPDTLLAAINGSSAVISARDGSRLVGLVRVISDGASICYLQDILVHPEYQRLGIGMTLAQTALDRYAHVRQKVLLTDDEAWQKAFYESLGYQETADFNGGAVRAFVRFD